MISAMLALAGALAIAWMGSHVPAYFSGLSPVWIEHQGRTGPHLKAQIAEWQARGKTGVALILEGPTESNAISDSTSAAMSVRGGPEPYLDALLHTAEISSDTLRSHLGIAGWMLNREMQKTLLAMLSNSPQPWVKASLEARKLTGLERFAPIGSPADAPLEAAILTLGLAIQADAIRPAMVQSYLALIKEAMENDSLAARRTLDALYMAVLSISRRVNWTALLEALRQARAWEELIDLAQTLQTAQPDRQKLLLALWLNTSDPSKIVPYLKRFGEEGWQTLTAAYPMGPASQDAVLARGRTLYRAQQWAALPRPHHSEALQFWVLDNLFTSITALLVFKVACFSVAGLTVFGTFFAWSAYSGKHANLSGKGTAGALAGATLSALLLIVLTEPNLLSRPALPATPPSTHIEWMGNVSIAALSQPPMNTIQIDSVTLLILGLFLLIQMIIYVLCLIRVADIRKQSLSPDLKIALLENEDNLFDLGLYVGLGGTVLSIILISLGIVGASLMAAYASTLFGIIFVAILKVFHVRPFKRSLLLQTDL